MPKSPDAFRTISEVADWLGVQAHVLRFWESKFSQVKPIKRAGGRRYYRPTDMLLLGGIKKLLHEDGMTIKGAQKLLREKGNAFVADLSQPLDDLTVAVIEGTAEDVTEKVQAAEVAQEALEKPAEARTIDEPPADEGPETIAIADASVSEDAEASHQQEPDLPAKTVERSEQTSEQEETVADETDAAIGQTEEQQVARDKTSDEDRSATPEADAAQEARPDGDKSAETAPPEKFEVTPPKPSPTEPPKPRVIDVGPLPDLADFTDQPSALSQLVMVKSISAEDAAAIQPLLARLTRLRASMASPRKDLGKD